MIYGIDNGGNYITIGYNSNFIYTTTVVSKDQFYSAFMNNDIDKSSNPWADQIVLMKPYPYCNYNFNLKLVKEQITDYLNGRNSIDEKSVLIIQTNIKFTE